DEEIGIGIDVADYERKLRISSINRKLINEKKSINDKKEEMRILYVALTRAEERLYITGNFDRTSSSMEKIYQNPNYLDMTSHLDWILAILSEDNISTEFFKGIKIKSDFDKRISLEFIENIDEI